jgi:archaellum component FlaC
MKKILFLLMAGVMMNVSLDAQLHLFLEEQEVNLEDAKSSAWVFPIPRNIDEALDDLQDYCKERSDLKLKKGGDNLIIAEKVSIPHISIKRGDLLGYCYITEQYYAMALVFQLGYDISLNSKDYPTEMQNFRNYAKDFMSYHYEQYYVRRIEELEKEVKNVEKEKDQNERKINNLTDKINSLGKKIGKEEDTVKIAEYEVEINTLESDMQELMDTLPGLESEINRLKAEMDKMKTESVSYHNTIAAF